MDEIKKNIVDMLLSTKREGMEDFLVEMANNGFFTSPCSGGNHLCKEGGLAEHSWNVCQKAMELANAWGMENMMDSVVIASLLHDYGKTGDFDKAYYVDNILKSGKPSETKPFKRNPDILEKNHAVKSVVMINRWIDLTEDEEFAILHHDGFYERANFDAWQKPTPLLMILHFADLWCSRVVEEAKESEE